MKKLLLVLGLIYGIPIFPAAPAFHINKVIHTFVPHIRACAYQQGMAAFAQRFSRVKNNSFLVGFFANSASSNTLKHKSIANAVGLFWWFCAVVESRLDSKRDMKKDIVVNCEVDCLDAGCFHKTNQVLCPYPAEVFEDDIVSKPLDYSLQTMKQYMQGAVAGYLSRAVINATYTGACALWKLRKPV